MKHGERDLNNIYTFNISIAYSYLLYFLVSLDVFLRTIVIGLSMFACLQNYYCHNSILLFSTLPRHMSSINSDTSSNLFERHFIAETEELLDKITETHPDLTLPSIE